MQLSEFLQIIYPYLSNGLKPSKFFRELLENITDEDYADDAINAIYDLTPDFLNRVYNGKQKFPKKRASTLLSHLDKLRFSGYINDRLTIDAEENLRKELANSDIESSDVSVMCAEIFTNILLDSITSKKQRNNLKPSLVVKKYGSIFTSFESQNIYFSNYFGHLDRLFYPDHAIDSYLTKLKSNTSIIIKGRQGSGKTTLALKLAELLQQDNPNYQVMYSNITLSWFGVFAQMQSLREQLPNTQFVWVIDDIHKSIEFEQDIINWPFYGTDKYIFITRNCDKTKGNPYKAEQSRWDDDCVIKIEIDNITFSKYLYADPQYSSIAYRDAEKIYSMCGGDLTLLENYKALYGNTISDHFQDEEKMLNDIFLFYFPNSRFAVQNDEFKDALKILIMGMFDFPIPPLLQNRTCNTILMQFCNSNVKGELEFEHASIAELLFSCIINYLQVNFVTTYESLVEQICKELFLPNTRKESIAYRINTFLQSMMTYRFTLPINKTKTILLDRDKKSENTLTILQTHVEYISASSWKTLVNDKNHRMQFHNLLVESVKSGYFVNSLVNCKDFNFRFIYKTLSSDLTISINEAIIANIRNIAPYINNSSDFILLLRSLTDETAIRFLKLLDQETIIAALNNNNDGYFGISCGLKYLHSPVNEVLEGIIGDKNLEKIILSSSMSAILQFIEYFVMHRHFICLTIQKHQAKILENQLINGYSVRRMCEIQSKIKRKDSSLLETVENTFGEDFYISLIDSMGNIQDLYDLLASCSSSLRIKILAHLQNNNDCILTILEKITQKTRSIGTLNLSLKQLSKESNIDFELICKLIGSKVFIGLISQKGNIMDFLRIIPIVPNYISDEIIDAFLSNTSLFSTLVERTIENRTSLGALGLVLYTYDNLMLERIEQLFTADIYMKLCRGVGNLPILIGIMQHSSKKMQIELAKLLKQNPNYRDDLIHNTIEDEKKIGTFALCLKSLKEENEECLVIVEDAIGINGFLKLISNRGDIVIMSRFLQYMSDSMRKRFVASLQKNPMTCDTIFENTFESKASVGTFHFALREMDINTPMLLNDFESIIGISRYSRLICELGNLTVFFQILQYSSPCFMEELINFFRENSLECNKMIDNTITQQASIRSLPLPLREINKKNPNLMYEIDSVINTDAWIKLFVVLGDLMTVLGCLPEMSNNMRISILNHLKEHSDSFDKIVSNTIERNISIGTLSLRIKNINKCEPETKIVFESLFIPEIFASVMYHNGNLSSWYLSLGEFSNEYLMKIQNMDVHLIADILYKRSIAKKDWLFNAHYGLRNLSIKNYDLLEQIENCLGKEKYKQLFMQGSSLINVLRFSAYSTLGMEICNDIIHDSDYFDTLFQRISETDFSSGFESDVFYAVTKRNTNFEYVVNHLISDEQWVNMFEKYCTFHSFLNIIRWLQGNKILSISCYLSINHDYLHNITEKWYEEILVEDLNEKFNREAIEILKHYGKIYIGMIDKIKNNSKVEQN